MSYFVKRGYNMNNETVLCPICGAENEPGTAFCGQCGAKMPGAKKGAKPAAAPAAATPATPATAATAPAEAAAVKPEAKPEAKSADDGFASAPAAEKPAEKAAEAPKAEIPKEAPKEAPKTEAPAEKTAEAPTETPAADDGFTQTAAETTGDVSGEAVPATADSVAKAASAKISPKVLLLGGCGLVVLAIIIILAATIAGGSGVYIERENIPTIAYGNESEQLALLGFGKEPWFIEKEKYDSPAIISSTNGLATLVLVEDGSETVIYYVTNKTQEIIEADDIRGAVISDNGNAFVYYYGENSDEMTLALYRDGKTEVLSEDAIYGSTIVISPNGSAVSWGEDYKDGEYKTMLAYSGKIEELGRSLSVYGLADNGKYVYYQKGEGVYVQKGVDEANRVKIASSSSSSYTSAVFNNDYSQVVVNTMDDDGDVRAYLSENGKESVKLANEALYPVYPNGYNQVSDLTKAIYYSGYWEYYDIYGLDKDLQPYEIVSGVETYQLSADGKELLFTEYDDLYKIKTAQKNKGPEKLYSDVAQIAASRDLKTVYFVTEDDELYYLKGENKAETVSYDYDDYAVLGNDIYYIYESEVFKATRGKGKLIGEIDFDESDIDEAYIYAYDYGSIVISIYDDGYDRIDFVSSDGKTFINTDDM
jgi:hypothetical protein